MAFLWRVNRSFEATVSQCGLSLVRIGEREQVRRILSLCLVNRFEVSFPAFPVCCTQVRTVSERAGCFIFLCRGEAILFCSLSQLPSCLSLVSGVAALAPPSIGKASPLSGAKQQRSSCVLPSPSSALPDNPAPPVRSSPGVLRQCSASSKCSSLSASDDARAAPRSPSLSRSCSFPGSRLAPAHHAAGGMEAVRSQLQGLRLVRALLEACEFLLPLTQFLSPHLLSAGCRALQHPRECLRFVPLAGCTFYWMGSLPAERTTSYSSAAGRIGQRSSGVHILRLGQPPPPPLIAGSVAEFCDEVANQ